jgi:hypothetical protein
MAEEVDTMRVVGETSSSIKMMSQWKGSGFLLLPVNLLVIHLLEVL